jgi:hypothetical protein
MHIAQKQWTKEGGWKTVLASTNAQFAPQLVFGFGGTDVLKEGARYDDIRTMYPDAHILLSSTAGEILGTTVSDDTIALTAIQFEKTTLAFTTEEISDPSTSLAVGAKLASALPREGLAHALIFSDGLLINGTQLVEGIKSALPSDVMVTGGLVGDGSRFKETLIGFDGYAKTGRLVLIGLYGDALHVGYGSFGGWDAFGPERLITKSQDNVLYEIDHKPALALYKEYLGDQAVDLPASGLLFPMNVRINPNTNRQDNVVRTLLGVDEENQSMTFAGDMPMGAYAKLMRANFERLIDGASSAASITSNDVLGKEVPEFALLVSCVGRKLVLKSRTEEEVEAVSATLGKETVLTGFYSYGEICPTATTEHQCQLHNQTMTITTFREA